MSWNRVGIYKCKGRKLPYLVRWYGEILPETGKPKRYSRSFRTKAEADEFKAEKQAEIKSTGRRDRRNDESLKKLCDDFLRTKRANVRPGSLRLYQYSVARLLRFFGPDKPVNSITVKDADLFMSQQVYRQDGKTRLSDWSRLQIVNHCRCLFATAVRWDLIDKNPFARTTKPKVMVAKWHHLKPAEYVRLLNAAPDLRWRCFYALAYTSGARFGELFSLTWADIDFDKAVVRIDNRPGSTDMPPFLLKDREPRTVPLPKHTMDILTEWQAQAPEGVPYVLLTEERYERIVKRWRRLGMVADRWENRFMINNVLRSFRVHAKRTEIVFDGEFSIHTFRKSYAQNLADNGVPIKTLQYYLGHADEKTTLVYYNKVDKAHADNARNAIDQMLAGAARDPVKMNAVTRQRTPSRR